MLGLLLLGFVLKDLSLLLHELLFSLLEELLLRLPFGLSFSVLCIFIFLFFLGEIGQLLLLLLEIPQALGLIFFKS